MNRKQWYALAIGFFLLGFLFMYISFQWKIYCNASDEPTLSNIQACVRNDIFAPFPYIFGVLGILFLFLAWLEPKKQH